MVHTRAKGVARRQGFRAAWRLARSSRSHWSRYSSSSGIRSCALHAARAATVSARIACSKPPSLTACSDDRERRILSPPVPLLGNVLTRRNREMFMVLSKFCAVCRWEYSRFREKFLGNIRKPPKVYVFPSECLSIRLDQDFTVALLIASLGPQIRAGTQMGRKCVKEDRPRLPWS